MLNLDDFKSVYSISEWISVWWLLLLSVVFLTIERFVLSAQNTTYYKFWRYCTSVHLFLVIPEYLSYCQHIFKTPVQKATSIWMSSVLGLSSSDSYTADNRFPSKALDFQEIVIAVTVSIMPPGITWATNSSCEYLEGFASWCNVKQFRIQS